jgi:hypothetical protein
MGSSFIFSRSGSANISQEFQKLRRFLGAALQVEMQISPASTEHGEILPGVPKLYRIAASLHNATPPSKPSSLETVFTFPGSWKVIFLALPPPR